MGLCACTATRTGSFQNQELLMKDHIYHPAIRTVLFLPAEESERRALENPVVSLESQIPLNLSFDQLGDEAEFYFMKLYHCNADWQRSVLSDPEFIDEINEFRIRNYSFSSGTRVPYVHYEISMPKVKRSGNYLVLVYRDQDPDKVILTRRMVVYESGVDIETEPKFSTIVANRFSHQQIDFTVNYGRISIPNPLTQVRAIIRQNNRWDNAITDVEPLYFRPEKNELDYHLYSMANNFPAYNEFRAFDTRSLLTARQQVDEIVRTPKRVEAYLYADQPRRNVSYLNVIDANGIFLIDTRETQDPAVTAEYVDTHFRLLSEPLNGQVYLFGQFTDWQTKDRFELIYQDSTKSYNATVSLKQGYYSYMYGVKWPGKTELDLRYIENSFSQAENKYDIIVYYRPIGGIVDQVIGYRRIQYFDR